jgi:hypothetical protein
MSKPKKPQPKRAPHKHSWRVWGNPDLLECSCGKTKHVAGGIGCAPLPQPKPCKKGSFVEDWMKAIREMPMTKRVQPKRTPTSTRRGQPRPVVEKIATSVIRAIFTNGIGEKATRIAMKQLIPSVVAGGWEKDLGGWNKEAAREEVIRVLRRWLPDPKRGKRS